MNGQKNKPATGGLRLLIPLFILIFLVPLACNLPTKADQASTITPQPIQETVTTETLMQHVTDTIPAETPSVSPAPLQVQAYQPHTAFSKTGPWVLLPAQDRLWAANPDGSFPIPMVNQASISWFVQKVAASPAGGYAAFVASWEPNKRSHLTLFVQKAPEISSVFSMELTSADEVMPANAEVCDPVSESMRALTIGNSLSWSPDGKSLAFIGTTMGTSADVYVYSIERGIVTQLSDEPSQAYDISWSPDGKNIVFFTADCFGTGAGFSNIVAWVAEPDGTNLEKLYEIAQDSSGERLVGWRGDREAIVETRAVCPAKNLRSVNLDNKAETVLFEDCYNASAMTADGIIGLIANPEIVADGKGGLYILPGAGMASYSNSELAGYQITYSEGKRSFIIIDTKIQAVEVDLTAKPVMTMYLPEIPLFSPDGTWWAVILGEDLVMGDSPTTGETVYSGVIDNLLWTLDPASGKETLFFMGGVSSENMLFYMIIPPDLNPIPFNNVGMMGSEAVSQVLNP